MREPEPQLREIKDRSSGLPDVVLQPATLPIQQPVDQHINPFFVDEKPSITSVLCIELCCGSAGLSAALTRRGPDAIGVDFERNPSAPQAPVMKLDLATDDGQRIVKELVREAPVVYIHAAVPCGTASRAREKPISLKLRLAGAPQPRQLRSRSQPYGFPKKSSRHPNGLTDVEFLRVQLANRIYDFVNSLLFEYH